MQRQILLIKSYQRELKISTITRNYYHFTSHFISLLIEVKYKLTLKNIKMLKSNKKLQLRLATTNYYIRLRTALSFGMIAILPSWVISTSLFGTTKNLESMSFQSQFNFFLSFTLKISFIFLNLHVQKSLVSN